MTTRIVDQLAEELRQLASEDPENPNWKSLHKRVCREAASSRPEAQPAREKSSEPDPAPEVGQDCWLCAIARAVEGGTMCVDCAAMYRTASARVVRGRCDCGHPPDGAKVYLYRLGSSEQSLCGRACVQDRFRKEFGIFSSLGEAHHETPTTEARRRAGQVGPRVVRHDTCDDPD